MTSALREGLLRTLCFHETWGHAPTRVEWAMTLESKEPFQADEVSKVITELEQDGVVEQRYGRFVFPVAVGTSSLIEQNRDNELWAARKRRVACRVARWLNRLSAVRFVALCNTTALGHARDEADLDFFVITRAGTIMQTRGLAVLPFKLLGRRPGKGEERDAVCLSYFVSDTGLDLTSHMLSSDDPYFRYWFLSLLPLYDDGVSQELWNANRSITSRHPLAQPWIVPPDLRVSSPRVRLPFSFALERHAAALQQRFFPDSIRSLMNRDERVIVNDTTLKFHVDDGREAYRETYQELCRKRGLCA